MAGHGHSNTVMVLGLVQGEYVFNVVKAADDAIEPFSLVFNVINITGRSCTTKYVRFVTTAAALPRRMYSIVFGNESSADGIVKLSLASQRQCAAH